MSTIGQIRVQPQLPPPLDPGFQPPALWNREYRLLAAATPGSALVPVALRRADGSVFRHDVTLCPDRPEFHALTLTYVERLLKFLIWQKGAPEVQIACAHGWLAELARAYTPAGERRFDADMIGRRVFRSPLVIERVQPAAVPAPRESGVVLGRHLDGCRIGFDLGGSDRKCAAVIDGRLVHAEEIRWDPYFQPDPSYHYAGIQDSLRRAAAHLPRVDAIGGSAAGIYIDNEPRVASLFRGVSETVFDRDVRGIFHRVKADWGNVPFEVANDGEVSALAGSMSLHDNAVLGLSLGTSLAAGYCTPDGRITTWLNELAFAPIDYRAGAAVDEWSGDAGCGAPYLSQQAVGRLAGPAGIDLPKEMPLADRLVAVQGLMGQGDPRAQAVFETVGTYLGYAVAHYADFYELRNVLLLGRVLSGGGGTVIIERARRVLSAEFPALAERIRIHTPDEQLKRHGQAIAAASLPVLPARATPRHGAAT